VMFLIAYRHCDSISMNASLNRPGYAILTRNSRSIPQDAETSEERNLCCVYERSNAIAAASSEVTITRVKGAMETPLCTFTALGAAL
jgi:hypothetical protein